MHTLNPHLPKGSTLAPAAATLEDLADSAAARTEDAIQSTKKVANDALDALQANVDDLRKAAPTALTRAAGQVEELARRGIERARETSAQVKDQVGRVGDRSVGYVRDEPVKSLLMAAAAGAAVAGLVAWLARPRTPRI